MIETGIYLSTDEDFELKELNCDPTKKLLDQHFGSAASLNILLGLRTFGLYRGFWFCQIRLSSSKAANISYRSIFPRFSLMVPSFSKIETIDN